MKCLKLPFRPLLTVLLCLTACTVADAEPPATPAVVRVFFDDPQALRALTAEWAPWEVHREEGWVLLQLEAADRARLAAQGLRMEEDAEKTAQLLAAIRMPPPQAGILARSASMQDMPEAARSPQQFELIESMEADADASAPTSVPTEIPGYPCYATVEAVYNEAAALAAAYPQRARWVPIGDSWARQQDPAQGYPLMVLQLGTAVATAPDLVVVSGLHPREYAPVQGALRWAQELLAADGADPHASWLLDQRQIHLILVPNPDGRKLAEQQILWRKNLRETSCDSQKGVDLNRNFPFEWGCCGGSSDDACSEVFHGEMPASEPEIQALTDYLRAVFGDHRPDDADTPAPEDTPGLFLDLHSYSELVLWPWGSTDTPAPNAAALATLGRKLAGITGYYPEPMVELYPTDGTSIDYVFGALGVSAYTLELGTSFFEPCSTFEETIYPALRDSLSYAAAVAEAPYLLPAGPDVDAPALSADRIRRRDTTTLTITANDSRYSDRNGQEPIQNILAAEVTIDALPGSPDAVPLRMVPADGALDSPVETMTIDISGRGLSDGDHTLYVRAQDTDKRWGAPRAIRLHVGAP